MSACERSLLQGDLRRHQPRMPRAEARSSSSRQHDRQRRAFFAHTDSSHLRRRERRPVRCNKIGSTTPIRAMICGSCCGSSQRQLSALMKLCELSSLIWINAASDIDANPVATSSLSRSTRCSSGHAARRSQFQDTDRCRASRWTRSTGRTIGAVRRTQGDPYQAKRRRPGSYEKPNRNDPRQPIATPTTPQADPQQNPVRPPWTARHQERVPLPPCR